MTDLPTHGPAAHLPAPGAGVTLQRLVQLHLERFSPETRRAYGQDLADFATRIGAPDAERAAAALLSRGRGAANALVLEYRTDMSEQGLAPATINRRLSAVRSLVDLGRLLGVVDWEIDVRNVKSERLRDTRGPGRDGYEAMLAVLACRQGPKAIRDRAILHLLFDLALRRAEVVSLDHEHVLLTESKILVRGKGRTERQAVTMPEATRAALAEWIQVRGDDVGPLFLNFDPAKNGTSRRLTGGSVGRMVVQVGRAATLPRRVRPHGLRHAAITEALELTGGDVRAVARFSRHRRLDTLMVYDDNRQDIAGRVARLLADGGAESPGTMSPPFEP